MTAQHTYTVDEYVSRLRSAREALCVAQTAAGQLGARGHLPGRDSVAEAVLLGEAINRVDYAGHDLPGWPRHLQEIPRPELRDPQRQGPFDPAWRWPLACVAAMWALVLLAAVLADVIG